MCVCVCVCVCVFVCSFMRVCVFVSKRVIRQFYMVVFLCDPPMLYSFVKGVVIIKGSVGPKDHLLGPDAFQNQIVGLQHIFRIRLVGYNTFFEAFQKSSCLTDRLFMTGP